MRKTIVSFLASALLLTGTASAFAAEKGELVLDRVYQGSAPFEVKVWVNDDNNGTRTYTGEAYSNGKLDYRTTSVSKYPIYPEIISSN